MPAGLAIFDEFAPVLASLPAARLHEQLPGPSLIHLRGRRPEPLFVSVLLHGDEWTGWIAVQQLLQRYRDGELPRSLSVFVGNVAAASAGVRFLPGQPDYNRVWLDGSAADHHAERAVMNAVFAEMRARRVFASIDVHNNTGTNPHYACVRKLDSRTLQLATLFGRTVVHFRKPDGVLTARFSPICPSVTIECGRSGDPRGVEHTVDYLDACLRLTAVPEHPVAAHDIELFHSVAIVKVPSGVSLGMAPADADVLLVEGLERLNFHELPAGTRIGWVRRAGTTLEVRDENGDDVGDLYLSYEADEIRTRASVMPSMLTASVQAIRQDCLCYLMERVTPQPE